MRVVHYGEKDPDTTRGGVESFARTLKLIFEEVEFMTPASCDVERVRKERVPVICDNALVLDWPEEMPVIGFQHGVAAAKFRATRSLGHWRLARGQARAARRRNVVWAACAQWIASRFDEMHGSGTSHIIYHPVDLERFDGRLQNDGSRLVLHDARLKHKGSELIPVLARAFPDWRFKGLNCAPEEVADRLRSARAFLHLSRYEGNSIVCNEAMAMNLPCFFTRVGLMQDRDRPQDVQLIEPEIAFGDPAQLRKAFALFLESLDHRSYAPREWLLSHATREQARQRWAAVIVDWEKL